MEEFLRRRVVLIVSPDRQGWEKNFQSGESTDLCIILFCCAQRLVTPQNSRSHLCVCAMELMMCVWNTLNYNLHSIKSESWLLYEKFGNSFHFFLCLLFVAFDLLPLCFLFDIVAPDLCKTQWILWKIRILLHITDLYHGQINKKHPQTSKQGGNEQNLYTCTRNNRNFYFKPPSFGCVRTHLHRLYGHKQS